MTTIKPTDEMVRAFMRAYADADDGSSQVILSDAAEKAGIAAVLAVVERDYRTVRICGAELGTSMRCERAEHDEGEHEAIAPGGSLVRWL
jgi:hypothetical protein